MSFKQKGEFDGKIKATRISDAKFSKEKGAVDICIEVEATINGEVQSDWWRGEMSQAYGKGSVKHLRRFEITTKNLHKIGFEGNDFTTLDEQLVGKPINFTVDSSAGKNGRVFYNVKYLNSDNSPDALSVDEVADKMKAFGFSGGSPELTDENNPLV